MSNKVIVEDKVERFHQSQQKIQPPYELDPELCLYSPQDNCDSLKHPRIADWIDFITERYVPELPSDGRKVLLMLPCTATKPYPFSSEHQAINKRLYDEGFRPVARQPLAQELCARLGPNDPQELMDVSLLSDGKGTYIHRAVISEPMVLVPYETITGYEGKSSPSHAYDDPGLFEKRGNAVSPWRADSTAQQVSASKWVWGPNEKRAYVQMHNIMAELLAKVMLRIGGCYDSRISWVAPGLTHRSFVLEKAARKAHGIAASKQCGIERLPFTGANDLLPPELRITCLPETEDCTDAMARLALRLGTTPDRVGGAWSRGGANATPLALPELLDVLITRIHDKED